MRAMSLTKSKSRALALAALISAGAVIGCGGSSDDAAKFAGPWTFESGELAATCTAPLGALPPFSMAGLGVQVVKVNGGSFDLIAGDTGMCKVRFSVAGTKATVTANQKCKLNVGSFGPQEISIATWTLELDGEKLKSATTGSAFVCQVSGTGVLVRGAPDGGVPDGGVTDAGADASDAPKADAAPDADASVDVSSSDAVTSDASDATSDASDGGDATGG
jgi:hypothetical protein